MPGSITAEAAERAWREWGCNCGPAALAAEIGCDPTRGPYRMERAPLRVAREAIAYWRGNFTTDKAVDLTTNEGWEEL